MLTPTRPQEEDMAVFHRLCLHFDNRRVHPSSIWIWLSSIFPIAFEHRRRVRPSSSSDFGTGGVSCPPPAFTTQEERRPLLYARSPPIQRQDGGQPPSTFVSTPVGSIIPRSPSSTFTSPGGLVTCGPLHFFLSRRVEQASVRQIRWNQLERLEN